MKVLIIDDNVAIQEILKEILIDADYEVETADTVDVAVGKVVSSEYDFIILDVDMLGGDGFGIIDRVHEEDVSRKMSVIILRTGDEQIPTDNAFIKGHIQKPFKSSDVLDAIDAVKALSMPQEEVVKQKKEYRHFKKKDAVQTVKSLAERKIVFGESYVLFEDNSKAVADVILSFGQEGYDIMLITSGKVKATQERYRGSNIDIRTLSSKPRGGYFNVYKLGTMISNIISFVNEKERPVIVFDNLNQLIDRNGMNSVFMMLHQVFLVETDKKHTFVVSVSTRDFTEKDKNILLDHLNYYNPIEE
ncbi:MAG: response regulator [Candidatus Methanomethylophilaceae archaeon]|nr:response regulator [Candidatus Methanomethylophilaceae archaeon]MDD3378672.1 response regulator [Candidatus Methanomethylophilaceae archaeon]MDY0224118.1 response regulator [Candidatus Methanomethylophilaceae archaeon]